MSPRQSPAFLLSTACLTALLAATSSSNAQMRSAEAHVHGVSELMIAQAGDTVDMQFFAPGADIVGFERAAGSDADKARLAEAIDILNRPHELFAFGPGITCSTVSANVIFTADAAHDDAHDHDDDDHDHDHDHDEDGHEDHDHDEHDHEAHDDDGHDHDDHDHDDHDHEDHDHDDDHKHHDGEHARFEANYQLQCAGVASASNMSLPIFARFTAMETINVQMLSASGSKRFTATRAQEEFAL